MHYCTNEPAAWRCELLAWLPYRVCTPYFVLLRGGPRTRRQARHTTDRKFYGVQKYNEVVRDPDAHESIMRRPRVEKSKHNGNHGCPRHTMGIIY